MYFGLLAKTLGGVAVCSLSLDLTSSHRKLAFVGMSEAVESKKPETVAGHSEERGRPNTVPKHPWHVG